MDEAKVKEYLNNNGVPYTEPIYTDGQRLRVMDLTALSASMRNYFDERGFYKPPANTSKKGDKK